jgi:hypothetical protein
MDHDYLIYGIAVALGVVGWFVRRDVSRFEKSVTGLNESINEIKDKVNGVSEVVKLQPDMIRFFGATGGQARLWNEIKDLRDCIDQLRERDHWLINKMTIIRGKIDSPKTKLSNEEWDLPPFKENK